MKKSYLKEYIKNEILSIINEEDKKKKRPDAEDEAAAELDANEPIDTTPEETGLSSPQDVQKELMDALEAAKKLGDKKLVRQIGNALTYFTRTQITKDEETA
jgi:hypothetical protein